MANRLKMAQVHTIEQLLKLGWSRRRIARELDVHRTTVSRYAADSKEGASAKPTISTAGNPGRPSVCAPLLEVIEAKLGHGLSAQRIYQDLVAEHGFAASYESVKRTVRKFRAATPLPFRRIEKLPGEEAQVDFGQGAPTARPGAKKLKRPHLFRIVLSFSRKAYSETVWEQTTEAFIRCLENAFVHFGGVPATLVLDNLKAAVSEADWFDPTLSRKFEDFCRHYGIVALPTKPYTPRHKGKIERGVGYAQDNAVKGRTFASLAEQNAFLRTWESNIADLRIHGTTRRQVKALFELERSSLHPLPLERFPLFDEVERIVHRDGHVAVNRAFYSVPPEFVGRRVLVRHDARLVRVFDRHFRQIALHLRVEPGRFSTQHAHLADAKISAVERGADGLLDRARRIGKESGRFAEALLKERGIAGIRALQGFLALTKKHDSSAIERVAGIAITHSAFRLKTLRRLLAAKHDEHRQVEFLSLHPLIRDPAEYGDLVRDAFDAVAERNAS